MKKVLSLALILIMTLSMFAIGVSAKAGDSDKWDGSADKAWYDPSKTSFDISTAEQLAGMAELAAAGVNFQGVEIRLTADLALNDGDASNWDLTAPAHAWTPIGTKDAPFLGTFDGQGHTISGIYMSGAGNPDFSNVGLFGYVGRERPSFR